MKPWLILAVLLAAACGSERGPSSADGAVDGAVVDMATMATVHCKRADDCRLFEDYCMHNDAQKNCQCLPLGRDEVDPPCLTGRTQCFMAPCNKKVAACEDGVCVAVNS